MTAKSHRRPPSVIIDRYNIRRKLANSEVIRRPTSEGQHENFLKLTQVLEEENNNQKSFVEREKNPGDKSEREIRSVYHNFCVDFEHNKQQYQKKFKEMSKSAKNRGLELRNQSKNLEDLEREAYRVEMGLDDPPIYEEKKEPIFVNKDTNFGIYDAKLSLTLARYKMSDAPK